MNIPRSYKLFSVNSSERGVFLSPPHFFNLERHMHLNFFSILEYEIRKNNSRNGYNYEGFLQKDENVIEFFLKESLNYLLETDEKKLSYYANIYTKRNFELLKKYEAYFNKGNITSSNLVSNNIFFLFVLNFFLFLRKHKNILQNSFGYDFQEIEKQFYVRFLYNRNGVDIPKKEIKLNKVFTLPVSFYLDRLEKIYEKYGIDHFFVSYPYGFNFYTISELNKFFAMNTIKNDSGIYSDLREKYMEEVNSDGYFYSQIGNSVYYSNMIDDNEEYNSIMFYCLKRKRMDSDVEMKIGELKKVFKSTKKRNKRFYKVSSNRGIKHTYYIPMREDGEDMKNLAITLGIVKDGLSEDEKFTYYMKTVDIGFFREMKNFLIE